MKQKGIAIIGSVGVPANYGGFETLAENLVKFHALGSPHPLTVYCSAGSYPIRKETYLSARLRFVPFSANGIQSIPYDILSLISALWYGASVVLVLGVSGAIIFPLVRLFSSTRIVTNIDGIEWRRRKWRGLAKVFLRFSEKMAVRFSHEVISDNGVIAQYVKDIYGRDSHVIAYGGDQSSAVSANGLGEYNFPSSYALSICRIEPENNVDIILDVFSRTDTANLVMVGNWDGSNYGRMLREKYSSCTNVRLVDPIYDLGKLTTLRTRASFYIHGHSAGGTNPSLVEAMHAGRPVFAFDCNYNRNTTEDGAFYFGTGEELQNLIASKKRNDLEKAGRDMMEIANRRFTWRVIAEQYFALLYK